MLRKSLGTCAVILIGLFCSGCGGTVAPEQVSDQFLKAVLAKDRIQAEKVMTHVAAAAPGLTTVFAVVAGDRTACTVRNGQVHDQEATVPAILTGGTSDNLEVKVNLRREDGAWHVYGLSVVLVAGKPEVALNFEKSDTMISGAFNAIGQVVGQTFGEAAKGFAQGAAKGLNDSMGTQPVHLTTNGGAPANRSDAEAAPPSANSPVQAPNTTYSVGTSANSANANSGATPNGMGQGAQKPTGQDNSSVPAQQSGSAGASGSPGAANSPATGSANTDPAPPSPGGGNAP